jgi:hypothetical protein
LYIHFISQFDPDNFILLKKESTLSFRSRYLLY